MKSIISVFLPALMLLAACKKDRDIPKDPGTEIPKEIPNKPEAKPVGEPVGPLIITNVTPAGATIVSEDGSFKVRIPVGAVTEAIDIELQEVRNTAQGGVGRSFQLSPHGKIFAKPVTLEFSWAGHENQVNIPEALGVAWQDEKDFWRLTKAPVINKEQKTVSIQTDHFSNWALLQWLQLSPAATTVRTGGTANLTVLSYIPLGGDDLLSPLVPADGQDVTLGEGRPLPGVFIKSWAAGGVGTVKGNGGQAVYTAPATVAKPEIANVTATLKDSKHQLMVVSTITVVPEGITFKLDGGEWVTFPAHSGANEEGFEMSGHKDGRFIAIQWPTGTGGMPWDRDQKVAVVYADSHSRKNYASIYYDKALGYYVPAGGFLQVSELGAKGEYVSGSFSMSGGGIFITDDQDPIGKGSIQGYFSLKHDL
ncbi:hypothetical protein [Chitinophaga deserti]|uniref:hypothetical protein n=1 Tax=Chitinophaga deserti TaxID=2164099 RepID=UPI000D6AB0AF|nr:hypothetical protein [Chitinophaga deserti]